MNRNGIDSRMSTKRIIRPSRIPPARPAIAPYERADDGRDERREEADRERRLAALHDPAELVKAGLVGAERMSAARRQIGGSEVRRRLVGVVDERSEEAEEEEEDDDPDTDDRELVVHELAQSELPAAREDLNLAALRHLRRREVEADLAGLAREIGHQGGRVDLVELAHSLTRGSATVIEMSASRLPRTVRIPPRIV